MADLTNVELLSRTLDLLREPTRWTKFAFARDASGSECAFDSQDAVSWCVMGALFKVSGGGWLLKRPIDWYKKFTRRSHKKFTPGSINAWNDLPSTTHRDVVTALKAALAIETRDWDQLQEMGLLTARQRRLAEKSVGVAE